MMLLIVFGASLAIDYEAIQLCINGGPGAMGDGGFYKVLSEVPDVFGLFRGKYNKDPKNSTFHYGFRRVLIGESGVVTGYRIYLKVEVEQGELVKNCGLNYLDKEDNSKDRTKKNEFSHIAMKCDQDDMTYTYYEDKEQPKE